MLLSIAILVLSSHNTAEAQRRSADLVVINGNVRTMTAKNSVVAAFAVSGNRITAVGTTRFIRTFIGPSTKIIDARNRLVLPGFNDAHVHFMAVGNSFSSVDLRTAKDTASVAYQLARFSTFLPDGRWILGGNFNNQNWDLPSRRLLDVLAPRNPVFLYHANGKSALANSLAFNLAKVADGAEGVAHDSFGDVTGVVSGRALERIARAVPADHTRNWPEIAETATNYAASLGVTSVQDMHSDDSRAVYLKLAEQGKFKTRVYDCLPLRSFQKLIDTRLARQTHAMVTDGCLKSFSDGERESSSLLAREISGADRFGLQVMVHAVGGRANRIVLDVFEQVARANGSRDRRFRIEHAYRVFQEDLARFSRADVIASMQPFLFSDGNDVGRYGTLLKGKALVAFGSDAPMVDFNPLLGIHAAVNSGPESISVYDAVRAYTVVAAYAEFREKEKGTIEAGKLADFVILSDDIFVNGGRTVSDTRVAMTFVDGKTVYQAD